MIFTDQTGRKINILSPPKRIISLVPSQTELLSDLGLNEEVMGITKFCIHPAEWFKNKTRIGGTKNLDIALIYDLQPDLIIANKEENEKDQVEILMKDFPVWLSNIYNLEDALKMILSIGEITGKKKKASEIAGRIKYEFQQLKVSSPKPGTLFRCAYFIWKNPWMVAGKDTFIHDMLNRCGLENCFGNLTRYPVITLDQLKSANCELALFSSEPFPFKEKHISEVRSKFPEMKILFADGEMFSWYGSRLLKAPAYFRKITTTI